MKIVLLVIMMAYAISGMCFSTINADETATSLVNDTRPDQMEIIVDVWPKNILSGDCVYVLFYVKNKSQDVLAVQPIDFFDNVVPVGRGYRNTDYPYYLLTGGGGWGEFFRFSFNIDVDVTMVPPDETRLVFTDIYVTPNRIAEPVYTDDGGHIMRELVEEPAELTVANFADKYIASVQQPWPIFYVTKRPEWRLVGPFLKGGSGQFHFPQKGWVKTVSGGYTLEQFLPPLNLIWVGTHYGTNLPDLSAWQDFEKKLSSGTLRDMFRLGRLQVQYLDGERETALNELRGWFAEMEPIQSMTLAASLCLPEGQAEEWEKEPVSDAGFVYMPTYFVPKEEVEAHREASRKDWVESQQHYRAMRRAFDEVVRPYNTLPKRTLREKSELE